MEEGQITSAIFEIIGLSVLFFFCSLFCYCMCTYLLKEDVEDQKPPVEAWDAKHYYDPLPSAISPPEIVTKPSLYSFKIQNGKTPHAQPHAVINPAVLQYPPGHVLEERQITPQHPGVRSGGKPTKKISPKGNSEIVMDPQEFLDQHQKGTKGNGWIAVIS